MFGGPQIFNPAGDPVDHYLVILLDLNAVEAMPTLLKFERALNEVALYRLSPEVLEEVRTGFAARAAPMQHTRILSIITTLLLNERAEGLMRSTLFEAYATAYPEFRRKINEIAARYEELEPLPDEPPLDRASLDRIIQSEAGSWSAPLLSVKLTKQNRDLIVGLAEQFLKTTKLGIILNQIF